MEGCCDLQVDVNGEETFMVHKKILVTFSGLFSKLFGNSISNSNLKVIFSNFPGGAECFELVARFCYNNGRISITPSNILLLNSAANFLGMAGNGSSRPNLIDQTEKSIEGIIFWTWSELLEALKHCQDLLPASAPSGMLQSILDCLVGRLVLPCVASPYTSSSENSSHKFSCDTMSSESLRTNSSQLTWWFEDFLFLNIDMIGKVTKTMFTQKFDHAVICRFLFYYHKSRCLGAAQAQKQNITEVVIILLSLLDRGSLCFKGLFEIYRVALGAKISKIHKNKIESLMGSQLDQATIDCLLAPSPLGRDYSYDVNLVLRLARAFISECSCFLSSSRLKKVGELIDIYLGEVAPDSHLKPSKFVALALVLPDYARESYDHVYEAMDLFLEVHAGLCEEEKIVVCGALNHEKLSPEALKDLSRNSNFPSQTVEKALITQQSKTKRWLPNSHRHETVDDFIFQKSTDQNLSKKEAEEVSFYDKNLHPSTDTVKVRPDLKGMHPEEMELKNACGTMQTHVTNMMSSRLSILSNSRSLPKLCS